MAVIYQITNMESGKYYIGSAESFEKRMWQHKSDLRRNVHKNPRLQAAWNKYGADAFVFEVIEVIPTGEHTLTWENKYLHEHVGKGDCYNINIDATAPRLGQKHSAYTRAKIAANRTAPAGDKHYRYGKQVSEETRAKIGATQRGVKKATRIFSSEGLAKAQENMRRNAREQVPAAFAEVHAKFPAEVQERYDFSKAVYTGALIRIEGCVCPDHGVFSQYAAQFRKGRGCPQCGGAQRAESKKAQMKEAWANPEERSKMLAARNKP
jgi:group I intron endonuclease